MSRVSRSHERSVRDINISSLRRDIADVHGGQRGLVSEINLCIRWTIGLMTGSAVRIEQGAGTHRDGGVFIVQRGIALAPRYISQRGD
tara:strand:+ start:68 stop:331 length:264 start_codon:yes stop_codon:yes gene_type:complete